MKWTFTVEDMLTQVSDEQNPSVGSAGAMLALLKVAAVSVSRLLKGTR